MIEISTEKPNVEEYDMPAVRCYRMQKGDIFSIESNKKYHIGDKYDNIDGMKIIYKKHNRPWWKFWEKRKTWYQVMYEGD